MIVRTPVMYKYLNANKNTLAASNSVVHMHNNNHHLRSSMHAFFHNQHRQINISFNLSSVWDFRFRRIDAKRELKGTHIK